MPDASTRCLRCSAVEDEGRWIRGRPTAPRPAAPSAPSAVLPPPSAATGDPDGARPDGSPAHGSGVGCLVAAVGASLAGLLLVLVLVVAGGDDTPAPARWSEGYAAAFAASCASEGRPPEACRCLRTNLERSFTEDEMLQLRNKLAKGRASDADEEDELLAAERRCAG